MNAFWKVAALLTATLSLASCSNGGTPPPATDTSAPTIALTAAPKLITAAGAVKLSADASDDVAVTKVTFYRGATEIGTDTTAPYEATAQVTVLDNGTVQYRAVASDAAGNTTEMTDGVTVKIEAKIELPVDTSAPTIALTAAPKLITAAGAVKLSADASDDVAVTKVTFYRGATEIGTDTTAPYEATTQVTVLDNGTVQYRAVASDAAGNTTETTDSVNVKIEGKIELPVDTTVPTIALSASPKIIASAGAVKLSADASDNVGVTQVTFYRGAKEISTDKTAPYEATAQVTEADNGTVQYRAVASDAAGNVKEATDSVSVNILPLADVTAPKIVSITPAHGAIGVTEYANIVVTFSEKMNKVATQAAYTSTDLPANAVTFNWNTDGTVLTIDPKAALLYTDAGKIYTFSLTQAAQDLAGNAITAKSSSFRTLRQLYTTLYSTPALDGFVRSDGWVNTTDELRVGDSGEAGTPTYHSFLSFDLSGLPAGLEITGASLSVKQFQVNGTPYTDLKVGADHLMLDHVNYGPTLTTSDFNPTVYSTVQELSNSAALKFYSAALFYTLKDDLKNGRTRSQYRLRFAKATDGDAQADLSYLKSGNDGDDRPQIALAYLAP